MSGPSNSPWFRPDSIWRGTRIVRALLDVEVRTPLTVRQQTKKLLLGRSPRANYTLRATAACRRSAQVPTPHKTLTCFFCRCVLQWYILQELGPVTGYFSGADVNRSCRGSWGPQTLFRTDSEPPPCTAGQMQGVWCGWSHCKTKTHREAVRMRCLRAFRTHQLRFLN
jgi:hypothetical protein